MSRLDSVASDEHQPVGGLGRNLAGILEEGQGGDDSLSNSGLSNLFGAESSAAGKRVKDFVLSTALSVIAEAFSLDALAVAGKGHVGEEISLLTRLPPGLTPSSPLLYELYGSLWSELEEPRRVGVGNARIAPQLRRCRGSSAVEDHWVLVAPIESGTANLAAVGIRSVVLSDAEVKALVGSLRSTVSVLSSMAGHASGGGRTKPLVAASVSSRKKTVSAEVTVEQAGSGHSSVTGTAHGPDVVSAIAAAAANACQPQCDVTFVGSSELYDHTVTIVIVADQDGAPNLGVAVSPVGDHTGPAEAVFTAQQSVQASRFLVKKQGSRSIINR